MMGVREGFHILGLYSNLGEKTERRIGSDDNLLVIARATRMNPSFHSNVSFVIHQSFVNQDLSSVNFCASFIQSR